MLEHPYIDITGDHWLRGNLHTHTTRSDGERSPQAVLDDYASRGYGFLMISDHDIHTSAGDYDAWDTHDMIMLPGNEITADGPHMLHVNSDCKVEPDPQRQAVIDRALATRGFIIANHPNWQKQFDYCSIDKLMEWSGYVGLEIYNGTIGRLDGSPYATNKWDILLNQGRRVWGFANDDSHLASGDTELGWNMAYVNDPTPAGVAAALESGRFYASTGVEITTIQVEGTRIRIEAPHARRIVALREVGRRFAIADSNSIEIDYPDGATYVRFECWGDGEQFAWTQPFWLAK